MCIVKGIVFTILQDVIVEEFGEDAWDDIVARAGVDGAYTAIATYSDHEFDRVVNATADHLGTDRRQALVTAGRLGVPRLLGHDRALLDNCDTWLDTLRRANDEFHASARHVYPDAQLPTITTRSIGESALEVGYRSHRRLCRLLEGFVLGVGDHFEHALEVTHRSCIEDGDEACTIEVRQ